MICKNCSAILLDGERFCCSCGAAIPADEQPIQPFQAQPETQPSDESPQPGQAKTTSGEYIALLLVVLGICIFAFIAAQLGG